MEKTSEHMPDIDLGIDIAVKEELTKAYAAHRKELIIFAARYGRTNAEAEEIVQTAFLNFWEGRNKYQPGTNIRALLYKIVKDLCVNHHRRDLRSDRALPILGEEPSFVQDFGVRSFPAPDARLQSLGDDDLHAAINGLFTTGYRILELVVFDGASYKEAAEEIGVRTGTIMSTFHKVRAKLRPILQRGVAGKSSKKAA